MDPQRESPAGEDTAIILKLGAEGGTLTLEGTRADGAWRYRVHMYDCSDDDSLAVSTHSPWTPSWDEAMATLDRWPWRQLYPISILPEFIDKVRSGLDAGPLDNDRAGRWAELLEHDHER